MIRKIIKPKSTNLVIDIPKEYIGQEIEYIVFPINNKVNKQNNIKNISSLKGALHKYADPSKRELEDKAWKLHIKEKYKIDD